MNTQALEYWFEGHEIEFERHTWGYLLPGTTRLGNDIVREIHACNAELRVANMARDYENCFMVVDPSAEDND